MITGFVGQKTQVPGEVRSRINETVVVVVDQILMASELLQISRPRDEILWTGGLFLGPYRPLLRREAPTRPKIHRLDYDAAARFS